MAESSRAPDPPADPWPEHELSAEGYLLPDDAPGHTVTLIRPSLPKGVIAAPMLAALLFAKYFLNTTPFWAKVFGILVVGAALLLIEKYCRGPWKMRLEKSQAQFWDGSSPVVLSLEEAKKKLAKDKWGPIVSGRQIALMMDWRRAQLAVWEWLRHTNSGQKYQESQSKLAREFQETRRPMDVFAVDADGVRFMSGKIWVSGDSPESSNELGAAWQLDAEEVRKIEPNAELVFVARKWDETAQGYDYDVPPRYLASAEAGPDRIRESIVELGGRALPTAKPMK